jgi:hypothetical protein
MRYALVAALLVTLAGATAAPAAAVGPLRAQASIAPPVQLFGDDVTARLSVIADTTRVDPAKLRVTVKFAPFEAVGQPGEIQTGRGRYVQTTWIWRLRCLTLACTPTSVANDAYNDFGFPPARVQGPGLDGTAAYATGAFFPTVRLLSQISPREKSLILLKGNVQWLYQLAPTSGGTFTRSPALVFWLAVALAGLCAAAALGLFGRWMLVRRSPLAATGSAVPAPYLERALALFFWANAHGDETLQRKALERVADELPLDVLELSEITRELAWSPETPGGEEVEAISQRAGVPVHPEEETSE